MAQHSTPAKVTAAAALLCLSSSMTSTGFAVPSAQPATQALTFGNAASLDAAQASPLPQTSSATVSAGQIAALSATVGVAAGAASRMRRTAFKTPEETYKIVLGGGEVRLSAPFREVILSAIVTGFYIGFGGVLCSTVGGSALGLPPGLQRFLFGAVGFPLSIFLTTVAGGQGFTPNVAVMASAVLRKGPGDEDKSIAFGTMMKNLFYAYIGNAIGLITIAYLANVGHLPAVPAAITIAKHKVFDYSASAILFRGVLGGWLIGLAVWTSQAAEELSSKFVTIWLCIGTYVMCQYEHCLANLFFVPCAIFAGAKITWADFIIKNLIPSTIGNFIGGFVMLALSYRMLYGRRTYLEEQKPMAMAVRDID